MGGIASAIVGAVASIGGALMGASASNKAAKYQAEAAKANLEQAKRTASDNEQRENRARAQQVNASGILQDVENAGRTAFGQLTGGKGISTSSLNLGTAASLGQRATLGSSSTLGTRSTLNDNRF